MNESVLNQLGKAENDMEKDTLEYITNIADAAACEKILKDKLTIKGCIEFCFKKGHKFETKSGKTGFAKISPEQHFQWVREYFGIKNYAKSDKVIQFPTPKTKGISLDLDSLFD